MSSENIWRFSRLRTFMYLIPRVWTPEIKFFPESPNIGHSITLVKFTRWLCAIRSFISPIAIFCLIRPRAEPGSPTLPNSVRRSWAIPSCSLVTLRLRSPSFNSLLLILTIKYFKLIHNFWIFLQNDPWSTIPTCPKRLIWSHKYLSQQRDLWSLRWDPYDSW